MRIVGNKIKFIFNIHEITNHLGKNPIKGGSPPSENRFIIRISLPFFLIFVFCIWLIELILKCLNIIIKFKFINEYKIR